MLRVRAAALCVADGRVLLAEHVKDDRTSYLLPGGGVEADELAIDALAREASEEAGVGCEVGDLRYVVEVIAPNGSRHLVQLVFDATLLGPPGASSDPRVVRCAWHRLADLRVLPFYPDISIELSEDLRSGSRVCRYIMAPWRA